jgi:hypothetical protein
MRWVEPDRRQHRHHLAEKIGLDPLRLRRSEIGAPQEADALGREAGQDLLVEQLVLRGHQLVHLLRRLVEHVVGAHAVGADDRRSGLDLRMQAGDADFEELVEVCRDDAQVAQSLK